MAAAAVAVATDAELALGIDLGTTSVKVCVCSADGQIVAKQSKDAAADVPSEQGVKGSKQDVPKLVSALHGCVSRLPKELMRRVTRIGVCGQMHGVLLWRTEPRAWEAVEKDGALVRYEAVRDAVSHLYTWQDSRCGEEFLASLPSSRSHLRCYSGYGCATLAWFARHKPEKLAAYDRAGTVQDFVVAALCDLDAPRMSAQNAASWGYFDVEENRWNEEELSEAGFPVRLLPEAVESGSVAGRLSRSWCGIPRGVPVGAALGDLQCSFLATLEGPGDAVLNVSTSAQLGFVVPSAAEERLPYFGGRYLAAAASLNGGNALAALVKTLQQWCGELGRPVPQSKVWEKLIELGGAADAESSLKISPLLLGERSRPDASASATGVNLSNLSLGSVFRATCEGLVDNLHSMMPRETLVEAGVTRILGNGSGLSRNPVLQKAVERRYDLPLVFTCGGDAAKGAAVSTFGDSFQFD